MHVTCGCDSVLLWWTSRYCSVWSSSSECGTGGSGKVRYLWSPSWMCTRAVMITLFPYWVWLYSVYTKMCSVLTYMCNSGLLAVNLATALQLFKGVRKAVSKCSLPDYVNGYPIVSFGFCWWLSCWLKNGHENGSGVDYVYTYIYTLCPRKNCTPRQCTVELSSPNAS